MLFLLGKTTELYETKMQMDLPIILVYQFVQIFNPFMHGGQCVRVQNALIANMTYTIRYQAKRIFSVQK